MDDRTGETLVVRRATPQDEDAVWQIFEEVVAAGDTYPFAPDTSREEALRLWLEVPRATYVAEFNGEVVGTYYIKDNQPGLGSHVCNCGYMVRSSARGRGVGRAMGAHSLDEARRLGYLAMQYNLVVATNKPSLALWLKMGFEIVGTLPGAFNHAELGLVDAHVMYRTLWDMDPKRIVEQGYDQVAEAHHDWVQFTRAEERARYTALVLDALPSGADVLDLGCGSGVPTTRALAQRFQVTGVDISQRQIALARQNVPEAHFVQVDATQFELPPDSLDAVVAFYSLIHVPRSEQPGLVRKIASWLRPGGLFVAALGTQSVEVYLTPEFLGAPMYWSGYDTATNRQMVEEAGFEILSAREETEPEFGEDITFLWLVGQRPGASLRHEVQGPVP